MGITAEFGFPWPDGTDLIATGDDAMRALAETVEAQLLEERRDGLFEVTLAAQAQAANVWGKHTGAATEVFDLEAWFDAGNRRYNPQVPGHYYIEGWANWDRIPSPGGGLGDDNQRVHGHAIVALAVNGARPGPRLQASTPILYRLGGDLYARCGGLVHLNGTTDIVELHTYSETDGAVNANRSGGLRGWLKHRD